MPYIQELKVLKRKIKLYSQKNGVAISDRFLTQTGNIRGDFFKISVLQDELDRLRRVVSERAVVEVPDAPTMSQAAPGGGIDKDELKLISREIRRGARERVRIQEGIIYREYVDGTGGYHDDDKLLIVIQKKKISRSYEGTLSTRYKNSC